ncbi:MAG: YidC/Oxa1 family insertase periplasmic-domain containing protein [Planctomycetes bacterium]|nr:YidC/Oxa1 family insertase periplasmic-domain containing protein [Planctomycetota bacterium]
MLIALRLVGILAATLVLLPGLRAQNPAAISTVFDHRFAAPAADGPGFLVTFDAVGASVRRIVLLDHDAPRQSRDSEVLPYEIVVPEYVDPSDPTRGVYSWLQLTAVDAEPFAALQKGLDLDTWTVAKEDDGSVRFTLDLKNGLVIEKLYAWDAGRRDLRLEFALRAAADSTHAAAAPVRVRLGGIGLASPRAEWVLGANPSLAVGVIQSPTDGATETFAAADGKREAVAVNLASKPADGNVEYAGSANRFFAALLYPLDDDAKRAFKRADLRKVPDLPQLDTPPYSIPVADATFELVVPAAGAESRVRFRLYLGPKSYRVFDENLEYARFDPVMKHTLDPMCFCTIPGARAIATFLLWLLAILHSGVGNWGVAIMILTVLVRGALTPVNFKMQKSMRAYGQKMGKLKPKLDAIQRDFKNDPKRLQQEMVAFQREHKLFPPLGGCLPMFATIPIFLGLFTALRVAYELRLQPLAFWIDDLSRPDQLFEVGLSWLPYFNLLPLVMIGLWLWLQASAPLPTDPQQRQMMKIMRLMPFVFGVTLYNYASGLMVYMITSSIFGLVEQRVTRRILGPIDPNAAVMGGTPMI